MAETKIKVEVGKDLDAVLASVGDRWEAALADHPVEPSRKVVFRDWETLNSILTPKRIELLRHIRAAPADGIRALARALDRDVKRVHQDVVALEELGLITRNEAGVISTEVEEIRTAVLTS